VRTQKGPGSRVPRGHRDHLGPVLAGQEHGVARLAVIGGNSHGGTATVRGDQPRHCSRPYQRLVRERHHRRADVGGKVVGPDRGVRLAGLCFLVQGA
jgi:hypothetical protein